MRYIRNVDFNVKSGKSPEFVRIFKDDVLPVLKQQPGFEHELAMSNGTHAIGISVWKDQASAQSYQTKVYPEILKKLTPLLDGAPSVKEFELAATTLSI
ncbi:MAG: antibiotic biosynthesis monooxygenase family protein [Gemmatimonadales bacterium]